MRRSQTDDGDSHALVAERLRDLAAKMSRLEQALRAAHPEVLTIAEYGQMRSDFISRVVGLRSVILTLADLLEAEDCHDSHPQRDYRA